MGFNVQTFRTRALTAVVFVIVMLTGLWWNVWSFAILFTIIHFGCWYEFISLVKKINPRSYLPIILSGIFYISLPVMLMLDLRMNEQQPGWYNTGAPFINMVIPTGIMFSIWINDTMAYIVGSFIGKTPFSKISPKKTWEGTAGGAVLCVLVVSLLGWCTGYYQVIDWIAIAAICAVAGTFGDLLESKIKRMANVKDSGSLMPGHGGFLDRFDSMLVAIPFVWLYVHFFKVNV
ncbi:MAG: phosphatidate cytidylyltransferase [Chitinophagaceae bacterium]